MDKYRLASTALSLLITSVVTVGWFLAWQSSQHMSTLYAHAVHVDGMLHYLHGVRPHDSV